ncbi:hypothetical protein EKH57_17450 (plasmid) [Halorubrum sp. BOL3-1]|uniref:restriction endonuclease n=1 Tax=Halorubrum sp. BOL3-1 TaxID=2497325 RepID=UPI001004FC49|nr:restriction endonuclease [Halorubrum sp. BOL3-1]QAU14471.1 hypothetical protein EKH57_17450 [Halorubrum sp. BOL3-1]
MDKALTVRGDSNTDLQEQSRAPLDKVKQGHRGESGCLSAEDPFCNIILLTDQRILLFIGRANGDIVVEFGHDEHIPSHKTEESTIDDNNPVILADGLKYHLQFWPPNTEKAIQYLKGRFEERAGRQEQTERTDRATATGPESQEGEQAVARRTGSEERALEKFDRDTEYRNYHEKTPGRIEQIINTESNDIDEILSTGENLPDRWLDIHARWESLRTIEKTPQTSVSVSNLNGIGPKLAENLQENGYETLHEVRRVSISELVEVDGIGTQTAQRIHKYACRRPLDQIRYIGPTIEDNLRKNGYRHGGDLSATSLSDLADVEGIGDIRAEKIQRRAGSWLPDHDHMMPLVVDLYSPPFDDIDEAEEQINKLEKILLHPDGKRLLIVLEKFKSLEITGPNIEEIVLDTCLNSHDEHENQAVLSQRWLGVAERLVDVITGRQEQSLPTEIKSKFDEPDFPTTSVSPTKVMTGTLPQAEELVTTGEEEIAIHAQFVTIATEGANVIESLKKSDIAGVDRMQAAISVQITHARRLLAEGADEDTLVSIKHFISVCSDSIEIAHTHPDYPFEQTIITLADAGENKEIDISVISEIRDIVTVADDALEQLSSLEYDHPAIDRESWIESIELALEEQYLPSIVPVREQLERLSEGLWEEDDLHIYHWQEFETLIGDLYREEEFDVEVTQNSTDFGVDIWAHNETERLAIQVKQFQKGGTVGRETLQKLVSTLAKGDADRAVVVTSGEFADTAKRYAQDFGDKLDLVGSDELIRRPSVFS